MIHNNITESSVLPFQSSCSPVEVVKSRVCSKTTTVAGEALGVLCATHHLDQHIHHPTPGENTLDLVLSDFTTTVSTSVTATLSRSDHAILICNFKAVSARRDPTTSHKVWKYDSADWNRLRAFYCGHDWQSIMSDDPTLLRERLYLYLYLYHNLMAHHDDGQ